jgi:hypothetical protein
VFLVKKKNELKNRFLGKKNVSFDFPIITIAKIWVNQMKRRLIFFKKIMADNMLSTSVAKKNIKSSIA